MEPSPEFPQHFTGIDVLVSGYVLTQDMVYHLCRSHYRMSKPEVEKCGGPIEAANDYYTQRSICQPPTLVPTNLLTREAEYQDTWLLTGKAAFFYGNCVPPSLTWDDDIEEYLETWFPLKLLTEKKFRGVRYVQMLWPRNLCYFGIIADLFKWTDPEEYDKYRRTQEFYLVEQRRALGLEAVPIPPDFPLLVCPEQPMRPELLHEKWEGYPGCESPFWQPTPSMKRAGSA